MSQTEYTRFTDAEMDFVHQTNLPALLSSLGYHVTKKGNYHSTVEMDSLRIKDGKTFYRYSEQAGGDAITFLQRYHNMSFVEAVKHLLAFNGQQIQVQSHSPDPPKQNQSRNSFCPNRAPET